MKKYTFFALFVIITMACARESRERIFEVVYPNFLFTLPAGLSTQTGWGYNLRDVNSNFANLVNANNSDTAVIKGVYPFSARITSLDGFDYNFVEAVSVLVCSNTKNRCSTISDEMFYIEDLRGRAREQIDLLPTERNVEKLLSEERFRLEVIFYFRNTTPLAIDSRLDMVFEAAR